LGNLLADAKKSYYEIEGQQFIHEGAWQVLKRSAKWKELTQTRASSTAEAPTNASTGEALADQPNSSAENPPLSSATGVVTPTESFIRPPGVCATKRIMKEEEFNAKKIKVLNQRASNYSKRTIAMEKTNEIRQRAAQAEIDSVNMEIMCKKDEDLPDDLAREFFKLRKEDIIKDLREQRKEKEKQRALESINQNQSTSANNRFNKEQVDATSLVPPSNQDSFNARDPSSNANADFNNSDDEYEYDEEEPEEIDPTLSLVQ
jgi:hypothetical protein